ncbi:MAG TPA: MFS transporter [Actinomycetota bacterium]|nr:MFS transporter [Actinomycetota bacterium]
MTTEQKAPWNRSVKALLVGVFCSTCGGIVGVAALGFQVFRLTHRELDLGLLGLAEFTPSALLVLVTGSVADRFDRKRVSSLSSVLQAAAGVALAVYAATRPTSVLPIFAIVLLFGAGRAFLAPSNRALPADVVPALQLPSLTARRAFTWQSAIIVGPVIAGFLYAVDPVAPYIAMSMLLLIGAGSMFFVETPFEHDRTTTGRGLREALEGLRFIRSSPVVLGAISLDLFAVLFGGAVALLPAIAEDRLGAGSVGFGWLRAAGGIGAATVTLLIVWRPITRRVGRNLYAVVAIFGVATIVLGATRTYLIAFIAMLVLSGADAVSVFIRSTLVPLATPANKRGRVIAVESVFIGASNELGAFESGVVGQFIGASGAIILGGAATLAVAGAYLAAFPALRKVDRFPEPVL